MTLALQAATVERGGKRVLGPVDVAFRAGETTIVVGPNGAGKSTLLRVVAGVMAPSSGAATLYTRPLAAMPALERARKIGCFLEQPDATFGFTARELVMMGRYPHLGRAFETDADRRFTDNALAQLDLLPLAERVYPTLSSGERQRVALARLLAQAPEIYLMDEPTARLDPYHALRVLSLARTLAADGRTVVVVEHDLDKALQFADRVLVLADGIIVADGAPGAVLTPDLIRGVYGVDAQRVEAGRPVLVMGGRNDRPQRS